MIKRTDRLGKVTDTYVGRVLEVRTFTARRNMSDTLDYSDFCDVTCVEALVWTGPKNHAGEDISFEKQFVRVDCSNHFAYRAQYLEAPEVDFSSPAAGGEPLMWANKIAWESHLKGQAEKAAREAAEQQVAAAAVLAQNNVKRAAAAKQDASNKAAAEALLAQAPKKGTPCTVGTFAGKVFWLGVNKFRGKWKASAGVKDSKGAVVWTTVDKLVVC